MYASISILCYLYTDGACDCKCSTDSVPIIVSTLVTIIGVAGGVVIAVGVFVIMRLV